jgi:hypothetical protein
MTGLPRTLKRIGVAADHGSYDLKEHLARHSPGNWSKHFSRRDSAVPSVIVAVWPRWRNWKTK